MRRFEVGDWVYLYNPIAKHGIARKFSYKYEGPFQILEKLSGLTFKIRKENGREITVHINRLKESKIKQPFSTGSKEIEQTDELGIRMIKENIVIGKIK